ncbi:ankyrin [Setomelanomma holmii]|uniref:Ankyrin n=1 Tax=Setomelanomma holmii TaxID=210430 RepID=A0A9P4H368_9PLEO|nr:ankyrin [Setomelanomma holmii]
MSAITQGNESMAETILETATLSVNHKDSRLGKPLLTGAIEGGDAKIVKHILGSQKAKINVKDSIYGQSPLSWAAQSGRADIVAELLEIPGIDVNSIDVKRRTSFSWAADYG